MTLRMVTLQQLCARCQIDAADCWLWTQACNGEGYPSIWHAGRTWQAARLAWELTHGERIGRQRLVNTCGERRCVNPAHYKTLRSAEYSRWQKTNGNTLPSFLRGQAVRKGRILAGHSKLVGKVQEIRARLDAGATNVALARQYGVHHSTISAIRRRKTWPEASPWAI